MTGTDACIHSSPPLITKVFVQRGCEPRVRFSTSQTSDELPEDEQGNKSIDPKTLAMFSMDWETKCGLLPMCEYYEQGSIYGADLMEVKQADKSRQAFAEYPKETFLVAISEMFRIIQEIFAMEVLIVIHNQLRSLEISLKTRVQILELRAYAQPGSREADHARMFCRARSQANKTSLKINTVMAAIRETHIMMNEVQVGRLTNGQAPVETARVMMAHAETYHENERTKQRSKRFTQDAPKNNRRGLSDAEDKTLKADNAALRNQVSQLMESVEKPRRMHEAMKEDVSPEVGNKREFEERAKVPRTVNQPTPPLSRAKGYKILNTGRISDESDGEQGDGRYEQTTTERKLCFSCYGGGHISQGEAS